MKIKNLPASSDFNKLLTVRNLITVIALVIAMSLTLVFCTKRDEGEGNNDTPAGDNGENNGGSENTGNGENNGGSENGDGVVNGGEIDLGGGNESGDSNEGGDSDRENKYPEGDPRNVTYEEYIAMNWLDQKNHHDSFENVDDFYVWFSAAKAEYDAKHETPELGDDGEINLDGSN